MRVQLTPSAHLTEILNSNTMFYNMAIRENLLLKENREIKKRYINNLRVALRSRSLKIKAVELEEQKKFAREIHTDDTNALFWLGLGLYWAEGAKTERWRAVFYNSDPTINKVMMRFFREICGIPDTDIRIQLILHRHVSEKVARTFWAKELRLPKSSFYKASFAESRASKRKRPSRRLPYGTIQISVRGKRIANKIKGWLRSKKISLIDKTSFFQCVVNKPRRSKHAPLLIMFLCLGTQKP